MTKFTCGLHITCGLCGHSACGNSEHPDYAEDPFGAMEAHKRSDHPEIVVARDSDDPQT